MACLIIQSLETKLVIMISLIDSVHFCDIIVLTETWQKALDLIIPGFRSFNQPAIKLNNSAKGGRGSWGGGC